MIALGSFKVRFFFVIYILTLGVLAMGRFSPGTQDVLRALGLRSAVGMLGYMLAGAVVAFTFLWFKGHEYRRTDHGQSGLTHEEIEARRSLRYPRLRMTEEAQPGGNEPPDAQQ
ncbi:MAG: hypothetical protein Q8P31_03455 [Bacillota bacterium]|nr:hypothetical protein [Bacillota bacterium]